MALTQILTSDKVKDALITKTNAGFDQVDTNTAEIVAARDGESSLLVKEDAQDAAIAAIIAGNVAWTQTNKTSDYTMTSTELLGTVTMTNNGATTSVELTLPVGAATYLGGLFR